MHTAILSPPAVALSLLDSDSGLQLAVPRIPLSHAEISGSQFIYALCTPTVVHSSFNPFDGSVTDSGLTLVKDVDGETAIARAYFLSLTAYLKASPSADLLDNVITLYAGQKPVARCTVEATTGKVAASLYIGDGTNGDATFAVSTTALAVTAGTIEADDNIFTKVAHGLRTGDRVLLASLTGGTGVTASTLYFFHKLTADTGYLCATAADAQAGTAINVTLDATSVAVTRREDVGYTLTTVDPNLVIDLRVIGTEA